MPAAVKPMNRSARCMDRLHANPQTYLAPAKPEPAAPRA